MSFSSKHRRHALGQHFLRDPRVIQSITQETWNLVESKKASTLVEIGPGRGAMTYPLIEKIKQHGSCRFWVYEKDPQLVEYWKDSSEQHGFQDQVTLFEGDFLKADLRPWASAQPLIVVSNLPYSSGTAILKLLVDSRSVSGAVLMFQREVAERVRAKPGNKSWGSLSLWIQNQWDVEKVILVPAQAFSPPPKVQSEVLRLTPRNSVRIQNTDSANGAKLWDSLLRSAFSQRRKMLRSSMAKNVLWKDALETSGIDLTQRAEDLDWDTWSHLFQIVHSIHSSKGRTSV